MSIQAGRSYTVEVMVDKSNVASTVGSGLIDVFATPMMIAQMELAASSCISAHLEAGQASVGTSINVTHSAATPIGMKITATATVTAVDRRKVDFEVKAFDEHGEIGSGVHSRFIIDIDKFMEKTNSKLSK